MELRIDRLSRFIGEILDVAIRYYQYVSDYDVASKRTDYTIKSVDKLIEAVRSYKPSYELPTYSIGETRVRQKVRQGETKSETGYQTFTREEGAEYTKRMALEHLVAAEDHLRSTAVGKDVKLCVTCMLENHLPALAMYAKEGKKFCRTPEECRAYEMLGEKVEKVKGEIKKVLEVEDEGERRKLLEEMAEELRAPRKLLSPARTLETLKTGDTSISSCPYCMRIAEDLAKKYKIAVGEAQEILSDIASGEKERVERGIKKLKDMGALKYAYDKVLEALEKAKGGESEE